jgi:septation ring formation regulator EzrA
VLEGVEMSKVWNRLMLALRKGLYLFAIEQDVAGIKQDIQKITQTITEIKKAFEDQDLRTSALHAMLINQQHQHLDITSSECHKVMHEVCTLITEERARRDEADINRQS